MLTKRLVCVKSFLAGLNFAEKAHNLLVCLSYVVLARLLAHEFLSTMRALKVLALVHSTLVSFFVETERLLFFKGFFAIGTEEYAKMGLK